MITDNPGQGNRGGQEYGEESIHHSSRNQDSQKHETTPEEEKLKQQNQSPGKDDKFSPGEDEDYNAEDFSTD
ncbi:MAG: hypothetical protein ACO1N9_12135 [Flavobacterium sp.]